MLYALLLPIPLAAQPAASVTARWPGQDSSPDAHIVRHGETLSEIAQAYGLTIQHLMEQNGIADPDSIRVGQQLAVRSNASPATTEELPEGPTAVDVPVSSQPQPRVLSLNPAMTVRTGDTLAWIALRYGVDLSALKALNGLDAEKSDIAMGQTLLLPATGDDLRVAEPEMSYVVQPGDSLGLIAQAHGVSLEELLAANRVSVPDSIQPGQTLVIPGSVRAAKAPAIGPARSGFFYHRVRVGDTMSQLARDYNTTPQAIVRYNSLPNEQTIFFGLEVRIPYGPPALYRRLPPTPHTGTEFIVSITRQQCWVMQGSSILYSWRCSTGQGQWATRIGTFSIKTKMEMAQSSAYRLDMPYWLGLYDVGDFENGIHGLPVEWSTGQKLWDTLVGQPATFGCAMLLDEDAAILFDLSYLGMPVHIVD